ncbi:MAG: response regulator transcription factor [Ruoffia tabacinasalis]|uniref:response regulator transcription factor n=1 Tax=Ruoffia sp. FAM 26255 TaxID=3259519 RepID=UPI00388390B4
MTKILIIEDDLELANMFQSVLEHADYDVKTVGNGVLALDYLDKEYVDLIITDIMMPEMDGYEFAESMRQIGDEVPILVISAKDDYEDKKLSFRIGVDDYMVKPIDVKEMVLRVEALLRRSKIANSRHLIIGDTTLNQDNFSVTTGDDVSSLPQKEFLLLQKLLSYPDKIFTRQQLMDQIWGLDTQTDERTIDVHIKRLRDRFSDNEDFKIMTIRGLGYKADVTQ